MFDSYNFDFYYRDNLSYLATVELPLPDPKEFFQSSFDMAWKEILAYSAAIISISLTVMIIRSFYK